MINGSTKPRLFSIHAETESVWNRVIDTSLPCPIDIVDPEAEIPFEKDSYRVNQRSIVVLAQSTVAISSNSVQIL